MWSQRREILGTATQNIPDEPNFVNMKRLQTMREEGIMSIVLESVVPIIRRNVENYGEGNRSTAVVLSAELFAVVNDLITPLILSTTDKVSAQYITHLISKSINTAISAYFLDSTDANGLNAIHQIENSAGPHQQSQQNHQSQQNAMNLQNITSQSIKCVSITTPTPSTTTPIVQDQRKRPRIDSENEDQLIDTNEINSNDEYGNGEVHNLSHTKSQSPKIQDVYRILSEFKSHLEKVVKSDTSLAKQQESHSNKLGEYDHLFKSFNIRIGAIQEVGNKIQDFFERSVQNESSVTDTARACEALRAQLDELQSKVTKLEKGQSSTGQSSGFDRAQEDNQDFKLGAIEDLLEKMGERIASIENTKVAVGGVKLQSAIDNRSSTPQPRNKELEDRLMKRISNLEQEVKDQIANISHNASQQREEMRNDLLKVVHAKLDKHLSGQEDLKGELQGELQSFFAELKEPIFETFENMKENNSKQEMRIADLEAVLKKSYRESW